jgi:formylglycine-generating enzyme required for sulfatase activity
MYRMVTGEAPPEANERMVGDDLKPAAAFGVSKRLSDALSEALAITAESRPQTVQTFQSLLWAEPSRTTPTPVAISTPDPVAPPPPTTRWWPIALALGLPALALGGWSLYRTHPPAETPHHEVAALHRDADDRVYGIARKADTPEAYESYLDTCAADGCGHRAWAEERLAASRQRREREAEQARAAESARQAEATRQADLADYAAAERAGTVDAYRRYLADCAPKGCTRRAEAQANLDRLAQSDIKLPEMVRIPGGSFSMGCQPKEKECSDDEKPAHRVQVVAFEIGKYEVTFDEWNACVADSGCAYRPSDAGWGRGKRPVINVSWDDAHQYVQWLAQETGKAYRLPTEAEWEYAARAGTTTAFDTGNCISTSQANYDGNYDYNNCGAKTGVFVGKTQPVGHYPTNPWGLHDLHGNVWEWVEDCYHDSYTGAPTDGRAWTQGSCPARVLRGGSWYSIPGGLRSANRDMNDPGYRYKTNSFRVARTLTP